MSITLHWRDREIAQEKTPGTLPGYITSCRSHEGASTQLWSIWCEHIRQWCSLVPTGSKRSHLHCKDQTRPEPGSRKTPPANCLQQLDSVTWLGHCSQVMWLTPPTVKISHCGWRSESGRTTKAPRWAYFPVEWNSLKSYYCVAIARWQSLWWNKPKYIQRK